MNRFVRKGILLALITSLISGFSIFFNKYSAIQGMDSTIFNILKNGGVAIILTVLLIGTNKIKTLKTLNRTDWLKLISIGIIGGSIPFIMFFEGLKSVPAPVAALLQKTLFIWVALMAIPLLKEKLNVIQIVGYALVIYVNFFFGGFVGIKAGLGVFLILGATVLWGIENVIAKVTLKNIDSSVLAWARMFIGVIVMTGFALTQNKLGQFSLLTPTKLLPIGVSIIFLTGYVVSWYSALKLAPATLVSSVLILATIITTILNAIFVTHIFPQAQVLISLLLLVGVGIIVGTFSKEFLLKPQKI